MLQQNRKAESQKWGKQDGCRVNLPSPYHFSSTTFFSVWVVDKNNRILNPLLTSLSPRSFVHRPTTLHVHCLHKSYWLAPFRLQNIVYLQLVTFKLLCVTYFPLADSHATLTWDAQNSCAQTIDANVLNSCYRSCAHGQGFLCLQLHADEAYGSIQWKMTLKPRLCVKTADNCDKSWYRSCAHGKGFICLQLHADEA